MTAVTVITAFIAGWFLWTFAEYMLHRFAMHELDGKGIMSREHLEHHVHSGWSFGTTLLLAWAGMLLVGVVVWVPLGWLAFGPLFGLVLALGWAVGYFFYEYQHAVAHLRGPRNRYERFVRRHHFHHHFGHPKSNHGVSIALWDRVFGTFEQPERVRVPRRLALPWLVDESGALQVEFTDDYVLVGSERADERTAALDRARAFASLPPED